VKNTSSVNFHGFGLGDAGGPIDSIVDDLCNYVAFTDIAARTEKNSLDSRLREGWSVALVPLSTYIFEGKVYKNWPTLFKI
jgi:hypothetical protein